MVLNPLKLFDNLVDDGRVQTYPTYDSGLDTFEMFVFGLKRAQKYDYFCPWLTGYSSYYSATLQQVTN